MSDKPVVSLETDDLAIIGKLADIRGNAQRQGDSWDDAPMLTFYSPTYDDLQEKEYIGVSGEYAFSKYYDLNLPYASESRLAEGVEEYDFRVFFRPANVALRVEIKTTHYEDGKLLVRKNHDITADIYVLAKLLGETVRFDGFLPGVEVERYTVKKYPNMAYPCRKIHPSNLIPLPEPEDIIGLESEFQGKEQELMNHA